MDTLLRHKVRTQRSQIRSPNYNMVKRLGLRKCFEFLFPIEQEEKKEREESAKSLGAVPGEEPERNPLEWGGGWAEALSGVRRSEMLT